jgi:hypothetical protein
MLLLWQLERSISEQGAMTDFLGTINAGNFLIS